MANEDEQFRQQVAEFFTQYPIHECLPEASKLLLLDDRIAITVAARALEQYHRPFGCVLNPGPPVLTNVFDGYELISFIVHVLKYYTDAGYVKQLHDSLLQSVLEQPDADLSSALTGDGDGDACVRGVSALNREVERTLAQLPRAFALRDLETAVSAEGVLYADFLAALASSSPSAASSGVSVSADSEETETARADSESLRKRIELLFPPPWDYTLEKWHRLNGKEAPFPHLSMRYSLKDALSLLLETQEPRVIAWDDSRGTPFSFISFTSALSHFVQNFCGESPVLSKLALSDLNLGIGPDSLVVVPETASFSYVLQLLRNRRWSAVPLVKQNGSFLGLLSVSHICFLFLGRSTEGRQTKWSWTDTVGTVWDNLVSSCTTHPATATHSYHFTGPVPASVPPQTVPPHSGEADVSSVPLAHHTGRTQITSKLGGAFLAKLGDYAGPKETASAAVEEEETPSPPLYMGADLPSSLAPKTVDQSFPGSDKIPPDETSNAASAVQALIRNITCSAAVTDDDLTLKQVITHLVLTDDRRVIFLDPETRRIRSYITPRRLFQFLLAEPN
eukprot:Gregarina_sp_Pseudo_9__5754@NODE_847_length_2138_cov_9_896617_g795_i0_p1_GENE_NODE_847_length_2138_cov_9_896617_g795_i0NODE_847_length_2138_cov_9_896617_g795_i0_p1_ORF_typecomplete_len564_score107_84CBS/PF00571_28/6_4e03CBS/PF00571_28/5_9e05CBS/PF00571_28/2_9e03Dak2/PF02734_17/0_12_NODE_847_length_2138_cov_9_896617_g795_i0401731